MHTEVSSDILTTDAGVHTKNSCFFVAVLSQFGNVIDPTFLRLGKHRWDLGTKKPFPTYLRSMYKAYEAAWFSYQVNTQIFPSSTTINGHEQHNYTEVNTIIEIQATVEEHKYDQY